ncbi:unnamed protein product [Candidula unifasciata]|uniref:Uncharacterized protein n=1 Tax=Candidula unifasciata TaxID=100452 RepID=A0A8S3ZL68_9EUPU|nr:unnamed protein product [Candidula unifasciata]
MSHTKMDQSTLIGADMDSEEEDMGRDWLKINSNVKNDGFRTGMDASQEQTLQFGFNAGYREALQMSLAGGRLQGAICAHLSYPAGNLSELRAGSVGQPKAPSSLVSHQLQKLLSSNTELLSSIPSLLMQLSPTESGWQQPASQVHHTIGGNCSNLSIVNTGASVKTVDVSSAPRESRECSLVDHITGSNESPGSDTPALSCHHVCSSKSHFWSQLQHFRAEGQTFGVD